LKNLNDLKILNLRLSLKAGAKVNNSFVSGKSFVEVFLKNIFFPCFRILLSAFQRILPFLRGANVTSIFKPRKLFKPFLENKFSDSVCSVCPILQ